MCAQKTSPLAVFGELGRFKLIAQLKSKFMFYYIDSISPPDQNQNVNGNKLRT